MKIVNKILKNLALNYERQRLNNVKFIIVSNNCWGYEIYKTLGKEYNTPFVGLYIHPDDYIRLLKNFHKIRNSTLVFAKKSKYLEASKICYPIGLLLDDIEIHFLHYNTEEEALAKWQRRVLRMMRDIENGVTIYLKICDRDGLKDDHLKQFISLPFSNKISIGVNSMPYKDHLAVGKLRDSTGNFVINGMDLFRKRYAYFDITLWLRNGTIKHSFISRVLSRA